MIFLSFYKTNHHEIVIVTTPFAPKAQSDIITSIDSWYPPFADYYRANFQAMDGVDNVNNLNFTLFSARLTQYLYSPSGAR